MLNNKVILVFLHVTGVIIQIKSNAHGTADLADTACTLHIKLNGSGRVLLGKIDAFQINIAVGSGAACFSDTLNGYLLTQALVVRLHSIQTVNHVVDAVRLVGCGVAEGKQRTEFLQTMQDNLAGQLTILKSQLEELAISFGEILMPVIRDIITKIQGFVDKLNAIGPATKQTIIKSLKITKNILNIGYNTV
mgnify:CR=1